MNQIIQMKVSPCFARLRNERTTDKLNDVDDDRNSSDTDSSSRKERSSLNENLVPEDQATDTAIGNVDQQYHSLERQENISSKFRRVSKGEG